MSRVSEWRGGKWVPVRSDAGSGARRSGGPATTRRTKPGAPLAVQTPSPREQVWHPGRQRWEPRKPPLGSIGVPVEGRGGGGGGGGSEGEAGGDFAGGTSDGSEPGEAPEETGTGFAVGAGFRIGGGADPFAPAGELGAPMPALVLSGGGSRGAFQAGVIKYLYEERGYRPAIITGTSVGAIHAAKLAEGESDDAREAEGKLPWEQLEELWTHALTTTDQVHVTYARFQRILDILEELTGDDEHAGLVGSALMGAGGSLGISALVGLAAPIVGTIIGLLGLDDLSDRGAELQRLFTELGNLTADVGHLNDRSALEGILRIELHPETVAASGILLSITMVDKATGAVRYMDERGNIEDATGNRILTEQDLVQGVLASSSVPLVYEPTWFGPRGEERAYWDGVLKDDVPVLEALRLGATDLVVIVNTPASGAKATPGVSGDRLTEEYNAAGEILLDEVGRNYVPVLDTLTVLRQLEAAGVTRAQFAQVRSFPLPRWPDGVIPTYKIIRPPFAFGRTYEYLEKDNVENFEIGQMAARHAYSDLTAREMRDEYLQWIDDHMGDAEARLAATDPVAGHAEWRRLRGIVDRYSAARSSLMRPRSITPAPVIGPNLGFGSVVSAHGSLLDGRRRVVDGIITFLRDDRPAGHVRTTAGRWTAYDLEDGSYTASGQVSNRLGSAGFRVRDGDDPLVNVELGVDR